MAGFSLFGKVSLDNSGFTKALGGMKASVGPLGSTIGQQLRGKMLEAFGAAGAIRLFKSSIERSLEIRSGASKAGVDTSTFQAIEATAKRAGLSVEDVTKAMEETGPAAEELRLAVEAAKVEMEDTGRIISGDVVQRMAELGDKFSELFGRIQPGLVWLVDWAARIYDIVGRGVTGAVAGAQILMGQLTGDKAGVQAGRELAGEAFGKSGEKSQSALTFASEVAAAAVKASRDAEKKQPAKEKAARDAALPISQLVQVGGLLRPGMNSISVQQQMADRLRNIETLIRGAKD